jgi:phage/plasmid-like protein (TIGR03299 family)
MAHELDTRENGTAAFVSRKLTAWHQLGTIIDGDVSYEQAMELGGLNWDVQKVQNIARIPVSYDVDGEPTDWLDIPTGRESYSIVRMDRKSIIGTVGENYVPLQNRDAFRPVSHLIDGGLARIETAGSLRGGKQVWTLVGLDVEKIVELAFGRDGVDVGALEATAQEVLPYVMLSNDHTGRGSARVKEVAIRVVCANTMAMAMTESGGTDIQVTHAGNVEGNYATAAGILLNTVALRYAGMAKARGVLLERRLERVEFKRNVLDVVAPIEQLEAKLRAGAVEADRTAWTRTALDKALAVRNRVEALWTEGDGHTGDRSAWEALQAVTQYLDHEAPIGDRGKALFDGGTFESKKTQVASRLLTLAAS